MSLPTTPFRNPHPLLKHELSAMAMTIATAAAVAELEECAVVELDGTRWRDTLPMTSAEQQPIAVAAASANIISFAWAAGLISLHPCRPYLVRIERQEL